MTKWLDKIEAGLYRTPRAINGRFYKVYATAPGWWVVEDEGPEPWPLLTVRSLRAAEEMLRRCPEKVVNIMSGVEVFEAAGTPYSCSVASEAYWSN